MCVLLTCGDRVLQSQISTLLAVTRCFLNAQSTYSSGLATGRYNRTDAARQRLQNRQLIEQLQVWIVRLRLLTGSPAFARQALVDEVSTGAKDVDRVVAEGTTTGLLAEAVELLKEAEQAQQQLPPAPSAGGAVADLRSCAVAAAAANGQHDLTTAAPPTPDRRRRFCLSIGSVKARPAKKKQKREGVLPERGPQGTPHPRGETVQAVLDSADETSEDEVEGLPVEALLSPPRGSIDFGPRADEYSSEGYDGESSGSDVDA